ncbi:DUF167 domain-containing protein [Methanolobus sp. ZRKC3]|uniref:DUF167 domain-containing protein n=1 Tax=Methanolobus sp. ZRKC3 TaxID=3125786 RepID=UPI003872FE9B
MNFEDALTRTEDGVIVNVEVSPGSKKTRIPGGYDPWRKRIEVKISEQAQKGKANKQLISSFSALFILKASEVSIISGQKSGKKSIFLRGADYSKVVSILSESLADL